MASTKVPWQTADHRSPSACFGWSFLNDGSSAGTRLPGGADVLSRGAGDSTSCRTCPASVPPATGWGPPQSSAPRHPHRPTRLFAKVGAYVLGNVLISVIARGSHLHLADAFSVITRFYGYLRALLDLVRSSSSFGRLVASPRCSTHRVAFRLYCHHRVIRVFGLRGYLW